MKELTIRKKPIVFKAMQFTRYTYQNCQHFTRNGLSALTIPKCLNCVAITKLETSEGMIRLTEGSYIIKDEEGKFQIVEEVKFNRTYDII